MAQSKPAVTPLQVNGKNVPWLQWKTEKDYSFWKCLLCNRSKGGKWIDALTKADLKNCKHMTSQEHIKNQATWFQMECGQGEMKWGHMICYLPEEDFEHYPSEWINFELKQVGLLQLDPSSSPAASSASAEESPDHMSSGDDNAMGITPSAIQSTSGRTAAAVRAPADCTAVLSEQSKFIEGQTSEEDHGGRCEYAQRQCSQDAQQMKVFKSECEHMQETLSAMELNLASATESDASSYDKLQSLIESVDEVPKLCTTDRLQTEIAAAKASTHQLKADILQMSAKTSHMDARLDGIDEQVSKLTTQADVHSKKIAKETSSGIAKVKNTKKNMYTLSACHLAMKDKIETNSTEITQLGTKLRQEIAARVDDDCYLLKKMEENIAVVTDDNTVLKEIVKDLGDTVKHVNDDNQMLRDEMKWMTSTMMQMSEENKELRYTISALKAPMLERLAQMSELSDAVDDMRKRIKEMTPKSDKLSDNVKRLERMLSDIESKIYELDQLVANNCAKLPVTDQLVAHGECLLVSQASFR